jgi:hypothetical protein
MTGHDVVRIVSFGVAGGAAKNPLRGVIVASEVTRLSVMSREIQHSQGFSS